MRDDTFKEEYPVLSSLGITHQNDCGGPTVYADQVEPILESALALVRAAYDGSDIRLDTEWAARYRVLRESKKP